MILPKGHSEHQKKRLTFWPGLLAANFWGTAQRIKTGWIQKIKTFRSGFKKKTF